MAMQAVNFGRAYAEHVGCSSDDTAATVACLRALPTETLAPPVALTGLVSPNKSIPLPLLLPFLPWGAVVDGALRGVPMRPLQAVAAKTFADVPFLIGSVRDEGSIFIPIIPAITGS
jgi:carboxylesterase type B